MKLMIAKSQLRNSFISGIQDFFARFNHPYLYILICMNKYPNFLKEPPEFFRALNIFFLNCSCKEKIVDRWR